MKNLEDIILSFHSSHVWEFYKFVVDNKNLNQQEKNLFDEIWEKAGAYELWNFSDLALGSKISSSFIRKKYDLSEEVIAKIVCALSYSWK